jgi:hypothetical protein
MSEENRTGTGRQLRKRFAELRRSQGIAGQQGFLLDPDPPPDPHTFGGFLNLRFIRIDTQQGGAFKPGSGNPDCRMRKAAQVIRTSIEMARQIGAATP